MASVHPTAIVADTVTLGEGTVVGPYCVLEGQTTIGRNCRIGPHAVVGGPAQHRSPASEDGHTVVGDECVIREFCTINRSSNPGAENATVVGNRLFMMANAHVGHDCRLGDDVTLANGTLLGGHVHVGDRVFFGGGSGMHQHGRVGRLAMIHGVEGLTQDVPPFAIVHTARLRSCNVIGLRRAGLPHASQRAIRRAFLLLRRHRQFRHALPELEELTQVAPEVGEIIEFYRTTRRGVLPAGKATAAAED